MLEKVGNGILSWDFQKECSSTQNLDFSPLTPILNFWPPELEDNKFAFFWASKFVVIYYRSNRKLTPDLPMAPTATPPLFTLHITARMVFQIIKSSWAHSHSLGQLPTALRISKMAFSKGSLWAFTLLLECCAPCSAVTPALRIVVLYSCWPLANIFLLFTCLTLTHLSALISLPSSVMLPWHTNLGPIPCDVFSQHRQEPVIPNFSGWLFSISLWVSHTALSAPRGQGL